jgi:uroporphyrinogen decarboxylase
MTPRERIYATLNRLPADRLPVDLWCTPEVLDTLRTYTAQEDEFAVYRALGIDKIVWIFPGYAGRYFDPNDSGEITMWGVPTRMVKAGLATYQEYIRPPLAACDHPSQLAAYPSWPDPDLFDYAGAKALADRARSWDFATIGPWISHFEIYCQMRGLENALMDTLAEPDFLDAALDRIDAIQTVMLERLLSELGDRLDIIFISDDMGMQENMLISLQSWETHFKPRLKKWCDLIHRYGKKVLYHTDGSVFPLIPGLIDCGIDILNPVQHVCPGMDMARLKQLFGNDLIFHGGVENQSVLPRGTAQDVVAETKSCLETLGGDGKGYICCSCHNAQAGTPVENILAMIETVKAYRHDTFV